MCQNFGFILVLIPISVLGISSKNNNNNCDKLGIMLYEDLNCKPVKKQGEICPSKFDCEEFSLKENFCIYKSINYTIGKSLENSLIYGSCNAECNCKNSTRKAYFDCDDFDCKEWLGSTVGEDCYRTYELNKCCSTGAICPPLTKNVAKCKIGDKTYVEGQRFYPKDTCLTCICSKDFYEPYNKSQCRRKRCAAQLNAPLKLEDNCAPVYFKTDVLCCPEKWICPLTSDVIQKIDPDADPESDLLCNYGNNKLKLGEGLERKLEIFGNNKNIKCECVMPPLLTCKQV